jgi:hypothetical protein
MASICAYEALSQSAIVRIGAIEGDRFAMPDLTVVTPAPASRLETLVEDYLAHCRARGLSPRTIRDNYGYALKGVFLHWAAGQGITEPSQITNRLLDRFSADLLERGGKRGPLSRFSVASFVESVNWWLRWLRA